VGVTAVGVVKWCEEGDMNDTTTVTLELPTSTLARLRERANSVGLSLEGYLDRVFGEQDEPRRTCLEEELAWLAGLAHRTDEEIEETRRRIFALSPPPRPLPEGKTLADVVEGKWPGDETDEQVREALDRLS
jgi:hypothetical protein